MHSAWWNTTAALVCSAAAVLFLIRVLLRPGDRVADGAHLLMAVGMVAMATPAGHRIPAAAGVTLFGLLGVWFAIVRVRRGPAPGAAAAHLCLGCAAMVAMHLVPGAADPHQGPDIAAAASTLVFTGYFGARTWTWAEAAMAAAPAGAVPRRLVAVHAGRLAVRAESAAHTAMNAVMGLTFLAAL